MFLRGSRARGDHLPRSDWDLVALVGDDPPPGPWKALPLRNETDFRRILDHPVRPLDLRDAAPLYDPVGDLARLRSRASEELEDSQRVRARARRLLTAAQNAMQRWAPERATAVVLDAARAVLVMRGVTPSGRRLLLQLGNVDPDLLTLAAAALGVPQPTTNDAEQLMGRSLAAAALAAAALAAAALAAAGDASARPGMSPFRRFLAPGRVAYWREGFDHLMTIDRRSACWIPLTLLTYAGAPAERTSADAAAELLRRCATEVAS